MNNDKQRIFLELLENINDQLYMYARALEKNSENAKDLVNDTILSCYENFENIRDYNSFKGYVFKTIRSKFRQKYRRSWLWGTYKEEDIDKLVNEDFKPDLPLEVEYLYKQLEKLPEKQKEAVVLFEISGFSIEEIKEMQGGTLSAVKSRIKRGREKLKEIIINENNYYKIQEQNVIKKDVK